MVNSRNNLTGKRFGSLTVIKQIEDYVSPSGRHSGRWLCRCDCEKHSLVEANSNNLTSGRTTSCGCGKSYKLSKAFKKYNSYDISGEYGIGFTHDGKASGIEFIQVDRFYPSSKTCHNCGCIKNDLKLKDRTFVCPECGYTEDRDYNAALNLMSYEG